MPDLPIILFPVVGLMFGLLTHSRRHLFGEGPPAQHVDPQDGFNGRLMWMSICAFLWPVLLVGGAHGLWRVYRARRS